MQNKLSLWGAKEFGGLRKRVQKLQQQLERFELHLFGQVLQMKSGLLQKS
jgi:hypothetical protein